LETKKILGISAFYHDSAAVLLVDGEIIAAAQEERFTRVKHTEVFPVNSIRFCMEEAGLTLNELDAVVFYEKPFLKFERLLQTYYAFAPKGIVSFLKAIPVWIKEKLFLKKYIYDGLSEVESYDKKRLKLLFSSHHLSHAASAYFASPFKRAAVLTIDGVGEWSTVSIGIGNGSNLNIKKELNFPHSVGLLYSAFTYFLGFKVNSGEYKLMGLAPFGNKDNEQTQHFIQLIKSTLVDIKDDGSIWLNQSYFNYATGLRMISEQKWKALFGFGTKNPNNEIEQKHCDLALAIQTVTEEIVLKLAKFTKEFTGESKLCLAGGVALNCVANAKLLEAEIFDEIYVQPAAGDAGGALGAALAIHYLYFKEIRLNPKDKMSGTYLGPAYSEKEITQMNKQTKAVFKSFLTPKELCDEVAQLLKSDKIVGWFQGRMEFGPRALGNRSILGNPSSPEMQKKLNLQIKYREGFRPFAPSVLEGDAHLYFNLKQNSPYMLFTANVNQQTRKELPENYNHLPFWERLYLPKSTFPAITHLDFSARIQTVTKTSNPKFHLLLESVKQATGYGVLVNTSFNVRGEPIVCTPLDAYRCFMSTDMDYLVIENFLYCKKEQLDFENKEKWKVKVIFD
jgi:carbamoyltransferase